MQIGCGNRPDYHEKRKKSENHREDTDDESIFIDDENENVRSALCALCRVSRSSDNSPLEVFFNNECNVSRGARFVNGKVRSYGLIFTSYNCGIVVDYLEINLSVQVQITLLHWMSMLRKINKLSTLPKVFIYDNACSVWLYFRKRLHETKTIKATEISTFIDESDMYIDRFHQKTHTRPMCHKERNIRLRPDLADVNTQVCEQTNSWLKQYVNILCNLAGQRSKYYYLFLFHLLNCRRSTIPEDYEN